MSYPTSSSAPSKAAVFAVPGTVFPHLLLDEVMPILSGSEWALLCVIVRQTLGWHDPWTGARKASDWLSHRQLKARTGRGSDAVCTAIDSLVRRDLIEVRDEAGRPLTTPAERRRASRLFYALSPSLLARLQEAEPSKPQLSEKPKAPALTIRENRTEVPQTIRPSRFRKAETTKETGTKYTTSPFGKTESAQLVQGLAPFKVVRSEDEGCGCLRPLGLPPDPNPATTPARSEPPGPDLLPFLQLYRERLRQHRGDRDEPDRTTLEEQARLREALGRYGLRRLEQMAGVFFESDSVLLHRRGYGLVAFLEVLATLAVLRLKPLSADSRQVLEPKPRANAEVARRQE